MAAVVAVAARIFCANISNCVSCEVPSSTCAHGETAGITRLSPEHREQEHPRARIYILGDVCARALSLARGNLHLCKCIIRYETRTQWLLASKISPRRAEIRATRLGGSIVRKWLLDSRGTIRPLFVLTREEGGGGRVELYNVTATPVFE